MGISILTAALPSSRRSTSPRLWRYMPSFWRAKPITWPCKFSPRLVGCSKFHISSNSFTENYIFTARRPCESMKKSIYLSQRRGYRLYWLGPRLFQLDSGTRDTSNIATVYSKFHTVCTWSGRSVGSGSHTFGCCRKYMG